jgi:hypothetical protein
MPYPTALRRIVTSKPPPAPAPVDEGESPSGPGGVGSPLGMLMLITVAS